MEGLSLDDGQGTQTLTITLSVTIPSVVSLILSVVIYIMKRRATRARGQRDDPVVLRMMPLENLSIMDDSTIVDETVPMKKAKKGKRTESKMSTRSSVRRNTEL